MAAIVPKFSMTSPDRTLENEEVFSCLNGWKALFKEHERGSMTIKRDGEITHIEAKLKDQKDPIDIRISNITIYHTFRGKKVFLYNDVLVLTSVYRAEIKGTDDDGTDASILLQLLDRHDHIGEAFTAYRDQGIH